MQATMKRKFIMAGRIFKGGIKNFFRNAWLSVAATAVMIVAITIMLSAIVLNVTAKNAIKELSKNLKVSIYLKDDFKTDDKDNLEAEIKQNSVTSAVVYISREDAKNKFIELNQNDQKLLDGLALAGAETLPASLEVSVNDLSKMGEIEAVAKKDAYKDSVESVSLGKSDARNTISRAASAKRFILTASIAAALLFAAVSVLIIFNTIRMAIFTRGEEIRIMKLIGATPSYIRGPFVVEACLYGIIAGIVANASIYAAIYSLGSKLSSQAEFSETYAYFIQPKIHLLLLGGAVASGIVVGIFSSILAMRKHLKLKHW
jgi:cell division transport system permease protein